MQTYLWRSAILSAALLVAPCSAAQAQTEPKLWWPHFLGPQRDGISREKGLNLGDWKKTPPKVLWKVPLGPGFSSTIIVGDRLYTMCQRGKNDSVVCLNTADGKEKWAHDVAPSYLDVQQMGPGPRATPTYHDGKLYCFFPMGEFVCLAAEDGKRLWTANARTDTGAPNLAKNPYYWGLSSSALVEGDLVIVMPGGNKSSSTCVVAYHKDTGKVVWKCGNDAVGYGSFVVAAIEGQRQLIVTTGESVLGIEPTRGDILWRYPFANTYKTTCCSPVWMDGLVYVSTAYEGASAVLAIAKQGDKWTVQEKWKNKKSLQTVFATSVVADGYIYGCHGEVTYLMKCVDAKTGAVTWSERMDDFHSFLAVEGHVLVWTASGSLYLVEMQPKQFVKKGELLDLLAVKAWAPPALADGRLYLRDQRELLCLDLRKA